MNPRVISIDGQDYIPVTDKKAETFKGMEYKIIRTYSAGVFAGYVESRKGKEVVIRQARRLWYWKGAASLSQMAIDGVGSPDECKFPEAVDTILVIEAIEIIDVTEKARESIQGVKVWKK